MTDTAWLADRLPQGCFANDEGEIRMRASGRQFGYEIHGLSLEAASPDEITAACERLRASMSHLSTNDMVHVVFHRLFATDYPRRVFPSPAARMIDDERRQQFSKGNYLRTVAHLFITNQDEKPLHGKLKAAFFGSTAARSQPTEEIERERLYQRLKSFEDSSPLKPRRLDRAETFRSLILSVSGIDYPAIPPSIGALLHEIIAQQDFVGGNEPSIGELHIRPVSITAYPAETVPQMLAVLLRHEGQLTVSVRFICQDPQDTQEQLQLERTFWVRAQQGSITDMIAKFLNMPRRKTLNQDIERQIADIDEAIAAAAAGLPFGWCTPTAIVRDTDPGRAYMRARQLVKDLNAIGMSGRVEDANASAAWSEAFPAMAGTISASR
jgi:type IV secretion system protein VirB4